METREDFLEHLWDYYFNSYMHEDWIDKEIKFSRRHPDAPFADVGPVLMRLIGLGATRRDISLLARWAAYNGVFSAYHALDENPGIEGHDIGGLAESLLSADPSGLEGRPGSAPEKN